MCSDLTEGRRKVDTRDQQFKQRKMRSSDDGGKELGGMPSVDNADEVMRESRKQASFNASPLMGR